MSPRLPRDVSAKRLVRGLHRLGYEVDHQTGSHIRLTTSQGGGHGITIPNHKRCASGRLTPFCVRSASATRSGGMSLFGCLNRPAIC